MLFEVDSIITDGITCANPMSYREYRLKKCRPCGWHQVNNDCWLSGFMYAAFASDVIAPFFSVALDRMWASDSQELRSLAVQLSLAMTVAAKLATGTVQFSPAAAVRLVE